MTDFSKILLQIIDTPESNQIILDWEIFYFNNDKTYYFINLTTKMYCKLSKYQDINSSISLWELKDKLEFDDLSKVSLILRAINSSNSKNNTTSDKLSYESFHKFCSTVSKDKIYDMLQSLGIANEIDNDLDIIEDRRIHVNMSLLEPEPEPEPEPQHFESVILNDEHKDEDEDEDVNNSIPEPIPEPLPHEQIDTIQEYQTQKEDRCLLYRILSYFKKFFN